MQNEIWSFERGQAKARHLPERLDVRRKYFYFPHKFLGTIGRKRFGQALWIMIWIYYYLLNGIRLALNLDNSYWIRKISNFATNKIWFFTHHT